MTESSNFYKNIINKFSLLKDGEKIFQESSFGFSNLDNKNNFLKKEINMNLELSSDEEASNNGRYPIYKS